MNTLNSVSNKSGAKQTLPRAKVQRFDDYELLIAMAQNASEKRISLNPQGQFTITESDRDQVLCEALESIGSQVAESHAQVCIIEFSRKNYSDSFDILKANKNYGIIYLKIDDLSVRKERNRSRSPDHRIRIIPDYVMDLPSCSKDDLDQLRSSHAGRLFEIDASKLPLSTLRDEVCLRAKEILQPQFSFRLTQPLWQELFLFLTVLVQSVLGLAVLLSVWALPNLETAKGIRDLLKYPSLRTLTYVACAGALGATAYSIRCIGRYSIKKMLDFDAYKWWYVLRPIEGAMLAVGVYAILRGGIAGIGARFETGAPNGNYAFFGLGFLIGIATEAFMEWLVALAKKLTNYRVQPPQYRESARSFDKPTGSDA